MPVLNFNEIPQANVADGQQDTFELFARDFLEMLGFKIEVGPDRGPDGGRDLIVSEERGGVIGVTKVIWLVSCKHKAHSGKAVLDSDETDITDRMRAHGATGFIGFYSTVISAPLGRKLEALKEHFEVAIFDKERIESQLLERTRGREIARRYFAKSFTIWEACHQEPANILDQYEPLSCVHCGKDLLSEKSGIIAFVVDPEVEDKSKYVDIYWACKGKCDDILERSFVKQEFITAWEEISDIVIPGKYLRWYMAHLNRIRDNFDVYEEVAFEKLKTFIIRVSQLVLRKQSEEQIKRLRDLDEIPPWV